MLDTFPTDFPQAATSQVSPSRSAWPPVAACNASEGLTYPLGSCRMGNCLFKKLPIDKLSLGKSPLRKYFGNT